MSISRDLEYAHVDELYLDPMNPRLGRGNMGRDVGQETVLDLMIDFTLDELGLSYLESGGFWTHEALLVTKEVLYGEERLVVIEGNRRLSALKLLQRAVAGEAVGAKWQRMIEDREISQDLFSRIPCLLVGDREEIEAFLGFRHVTGIKQWDPAEKAQFINKLITEREMSYDQVRKKIGSKAPTVRRNFISYRILLQIEGTVEDVPLERLERRFSVMFLTLREPGAQSYLHINIEAEPEEALRPVPQEHLDNLANFARWLYGTETEGPLFTDSRRASEFARALQSPEAVEYLETDDRPILDIAYQIAGGDEEDIVGYVKRASYNVQWALQRAHHYSRSSEMLEAVETLGADVFRLLTLFPDIRRRLEEESS